MATVEDYYGKKESRIGYRLFLRDAQHFGLYPLVGDSNISEWEAQKRHHDRIFAQLDLEAGHKVLDIGCGRGIVAKDLSQRYGLDITGIDLTPYIVEEAKKNNSMLDNPPTFINGSYQELPFEHDSFDGLYAVETLSHATDLAKAVEEAFRVVKPGRKSVFFEYKIDEDVELTEYEKRMYDLVNEGSSMASLDKFTGNTFKELLEKTGFRDVKVTDVSLEAEKSFRRLYRFARFPYFFIRLFGLQKTFINATAAVEYYKLARKGYLRYCIYEGVVA
ncbi:MAG: methyltransferase domain-containing protein [Candidatus Dojkabacteria bacterium]|nr:MAG: methyltransferase domain-containing protein [Candidatus Dojkabacteria bacterium]